MTPYILSTALVKSLNWLSCNRDPLIAERRAKGKASKFDAFVGRTIDVPAPIFGVDIPDLYYRGTVLKKDNEHAGTPSFAAQSSSPCFLASQSAWCILYDLHVNSLGQCWQQRQSASLHRTAGVQGF